MEYSYLYDRHILPLEECYSVLPKEILIFKFFEMHFDPLCTLPKFELKSTPCITYSMQILLKSYICTNQLYISNLSLVLSPYSNLVVSLSLTHSSTQVINKID